ncbi:hypothetical protein SAMN02745784_02169 [Tissierella praeacuta DSM 18095]|uniref:Uncharacterized protein n=1 Tax=Tissierella praeacuta DSM 18095 TaxID=1123404 RepID=A0A1M4X9T8_9FIRM|nr:hypothetical protein [Tissierella praeacuta]SHE90125.1 hypothetical protein SAMN02745784_02169 [Tissierella praeacuta DSM 18095]SUP02545.1 Uncharacterised protein [Tissierella praeacuta]
MKKEMTNPTAGDQTSTWYEWYIGIDFLVDLIDPNSIVRAVIFQADDSQKLDDVVIRYKNKTEKRFQVKHTTDNSSLGLETLINKYLEDFSLEWHNLYNDSNDLQFILYTNRKSSGDYNGNKDKGIYLRPKLSTFWDYIKSTIKDAKSIDEIVMKEPEWDTVWGKFLEKIEHLNTTKEDLRLKFLENFDIQLAQPDLFDNNEIIIDKIEKMYSVDRRRANDILDKLKSKLSDWVTKEGKLKRKSQEVTNDMVIQAMFETLPNRCVGKHNLPVIANGFESRKLFASKLKDVLYETDKKIVFLSGSPQSGKTTLVSYLYSIEKAIDFRFHAFKPIMADGSNMGSDKGISSYRGLWGDLYIQIVEYIYKNDIDLYNIPITPFIDWIDDADLQSETLRILGELGKKLNRKIIVAIDGIDHAARSGEEETFLNRFCYPDNIPDNVCLLIVGQPYEAYKHKYPSWIVDDKYVKTCDMPALEKDDVALLLASLPAVLDINIVKDIIFEVSKGNALSAIFAAKEAEKCQDIETFSAIIESRKLKFGVDKYYEAIWEYCKTEITSYITTKEHISEIELSIATILSIIERPLSADLFFEINKNLKLPYHAWIDIFKKLQPLVNVENEKISCEISDVRVFFKGYTHTIYSDEKLDEIKIKIAKYFYDNDECVYERHNLNYDLLKESSQQILFAEKLNAEYVAEGFTIGQKIDCIREEIQFALSIAIAYKRDDLLVNIASSLKIFEQFNKSTEYAGYVYDEVINDFYFLPGEAVPKQKNYTFKEMENIINDALLLSENGKNERSISILEKHFSNRDICEIVKIFSKEINGKIEIYPYYQELIKSLGKVCRICEKNIFSHNINCINTIKPSVVQIFMSNFFNGWFDATQKNNYKNFTKTFSLLPFFATGRELFTFLENTYNDDKWDSIMENIDLICSLKPSKPVVLQLVSWQIQNRNIKENFNVILDDIRNLGTKFLDDFKFSKFETSEYKMLSFMNLAFCLGYIGIKEDFKYIADDYYNFIDNSERERFELMLCANHLVGNIFANPLDFEDCKIIVETHLKQSIINYSSHLYFYEYVSDIFNKLIKLSFEIIEFRKYLITKFKSTLSLLESESKWNCFASPIILPFLYTLGENIQTTNYMYKIAGKEGVIWKWSLTDRTSEFQAIKSCAEQIKMPNEFMIQLDDYKRCFANGYTEHKEDVLYDLIICLEAIINIKPDLWKKYLDDVIHINLLTEPVSDSNYLLRFYEIFALCAYNESVDMLYQLIKAVKGNNDDKIHIVRRVFNDLLYANTIKLKDVLETWVFFYKYFNITQEYSAYNMKWLAETKQAIKSYCTENNYDIQKLYKIEEINEKYYYPTSGLSGSIKNITSCTFDELLTKLEINSSKRILRDSDCLEFLDRIESERPIKFNNYLKQFCKLISEQKFGYTLRNSGYDYVFSRLYEFLCDDDMFEFLNDVINSQKVESMNSQWAHISYDIIQHFYLYLNRNELFKIEALLISNIEVHKLILSGKGKINLPIVHVHNINPSNNNHEWSDIIQLFE